MISKLTLHPEAPNTPANSGETLDRDRKAEGPKEIATKKCRERDRETITSSDQRK